MTLQNLIEHCLAKQGAYLDFPFGPSPLCARIGKRIFAEISLTRPWVTLKCEPVYGQMLRHKYPETIRRGYHCPPPQHPYNNTITLDGTVPDEELCAMIDHSYDRALAALTRAQRAEALERTADAVDPASFVMAEEAQPEAASNHHS